MTLALENSSVTTFSDKIQDTWQPQRTCTHRNPVVETGKFAFKATNVVQIDDNATKKAAKLIRQKMLVESYTPRTWRAHSLHICPPEPYHSENPLHQLVLDWMFLISSLNFSFWSEKAGQPDCYGVEWRSGWAADDKVVHRGYWSLVAALNRALDEDIPITDPNFYSSQVLCPDNLIEHVFRPAQSSTESIPLLPERMTIMRENGRILCQSYGGSFNGFVDEFHRRYGGQGSALDLVEMVTEAFPSFRDQVTFEGRTVYIWKRAQILVAEIWAAFYPPSPDLVPHPIFPGIEGPKIHLLTMFADYRVPQILHHLRILSYPPSLVKTLQSNSHLAPGSREELSLRSASIVAVEQLRDEILLLIKEEDGERELALRLGEVSSVLIDFYLWDLAKKIESGEEKIDGLETAEIVPAHRTRSIWY